MDVFNFLMENSVWAAIGFTAKWMYDKSRKMRVNKYIKEFFGLRGREIVICHTASVAAPHRPDIPLADVQAAYRLASFLEGTKIVAHHNIQVIPYFELLRPDGLIRDEFKNCNLLIIGGPRHNKAADMIFQKSHNLRYRMIFDPHAGTHYIQDTVTQNEIRSTSDSVGQGRDFGLILSLPNPLNSSQHVVLLAGIHGSGTLGAERIVSNPKELKELCHSRRNGIIERILLADYSDNQLRVTQASLL